MDHEMGYPDDEITIPFGWRRLVNYRIEGPEDADICSRACEAAVRLGHRVDLPAGWPGPP